MEGDGRSGVGAVAGDLDRAERLALGILLDEDMPLTVHLGDQQVGKRVDAGDAHAVQTAGHLVAVLVELATGMEDRHDHFEGGTVLLRVHARRDAAAVVGHADRIIFQDGDGDIGAVAGHGFVDAVVDHLVYQVVQPPLPYVSDVHRRSLPHGLKAFQHLDATGGILFFRLFRRFVFDHKSRICINIQIYAIFLRNPALFRP